MLSDTVPTAYEHGHRIALLGSIAIAVALVLIAIVWLLTPTGRGR